MKAFAYLRVSGKGQIDGDGFERQEIACRQFAFVAGIEIAEIFREKGVSGTKELDDRPALAELFAALDENGVKTVIIEKLDRLARDLMIQEALVADMQKQGYTLISTCEPDLCSDDPSRKLMRQIMGAIAEYDKTMTVLKLRGARERKKAKTGKCEGQHAFGEKPGEDVILYKIRQSREVGMTCAAIATYLNLEHHSTRSGKPWRASVVAKIIKRL